MLTINQSNIFIFLDGHLFTALILSAEVFFPQFVLKMEDLIADVVTIIQSSLLFVFLDGRLFTTLILSAEVFSTQFVMTMEVQ